MSVPNALHIGLSLSPTWMRGPSWRRADSRAEELFDLGLYLEVARRAEEAKLDFVFKPDIPLLDPAMMGSGFGFAALDPTVLTSALAAGTRRIGLITTVSTTFSQPFDVARRLQSLQWVSNGRAGWNMVTSLGGQANFGLTDMPDADTRYAQAAEFVEVVRDLWAGFPADALVLDRDAGRFADPGRIRASDHVGSFFSVAGPLNVPGHRAGPPPLLQAGASPAGRHFAASVADAVFASTPDMAAAVELRGDLRRRAAERGRDPDGVRVLPGLSLTLAASEDEARELHRESQGDHDAERALAYVEATLGVDLRSIPRDQPLPLDLVSGDRPAGGGPTERSRTHAELLRRHIVHDRPTVAELLARPEATPSAHWSVVGTVDQAVGEIVEWVEAGACDGFIALPVGSWSSFDLVLTELVPRLVERGLFRAEYTAVTLAGHLGVPVPAGWDRRIGHEATLLDPSSQEE